MTAPRRIIPDLCCAAIIDVQPFFLSQVDKRLRARLKTNIGNFAELIGFYRIPLVVTLERPVNGKGALPRDVKKRLHAGQPIFEKDAFDLCKDEPIRRHLTGLKKKQIIVAGCETDVCVLQSCLGLLDLGYTVFVLEELIFSSARNVDAAITRMRSEGAIFLSFKTLYYELLETVDGPIGRRKTRATREPFPDEIPDNAV
jgi:nicotinamidase-related amidase